MEKESMGCCFVTTIFLGFFYWPFWLLSIAGAVILGFNQSGGSKND